MAEIIITCGLVLLLELTGIAAWDAQRNRRSASRRPTPQALRRHSPQSSSQPKPHTKPAQPPAANADDKPLEDLFPPREQVPPHDQLAHLALVHLTPDAPAQHDRSWM